MGSSTSGFLTPEDITELMETSGFNSVEVEKLYERFMQLDRFKQGFITAEEFELIPELSLNPLCQRITQLFDRRNNDQCNFKDFVSIMWIFSPRCDRETKYMFAFRCYDVDEDGWISADDLYNILSMMVGKEMDAKCLRIIANNLVNNQSSDGRLGLDDFKLLVSSNELASCMTLAL